MVIVESIALATMISNHVVIPLWLKLRPASGAGDDLRSVVLMARRLAIAAVLALGYGYYQFSGRHGGAGGHRADRLSGRGAGLSGAGRRALLARGDADRRDAGAGDGLCHLGLYLVSAVLRAGGGAVRGGLCPGPFRPDWLRPQALFGTEGMDPLTHALFWSLALNTAAFCLGSLLTFPGPVERLQGAAFVNVFEGGAGRGALVARPGRAGGAVDDGAADPGRGGGAGAVSDRSARAGQGGVPSRTDARFPGPVWRRGCPARSGRRRRTR
jgi:hypothetical protein